MAHLRRTCVNIEVSVSCALALEKTVSAVRGRLWHEQNLGFVRNIRTIMLCALTRIHTHLCVCSHFTNGVMSSGLWACAALTTGHQIPTPPTPQFTCWSPSRTSIACVCVRMLIGLQHHRISNPTNAPQNICSHSKFDYRRLFKFQSGKLFFFSVLLFRAW